MALVRRNGRRESNIWPGFVDALTALLLVLMFVLTIFMVIQSVLRETITTQDSQLDSLTGQLADLADALGLERQKSAELTAAVDAARVERERQVATIATLTATLSTREGELAAAAGRIASFEEQVAGLLAEKGRIETELAGARTDLDRQAEEARLAAARRAALEALVAELQGKAAESAQRLSEAEAARLADAAAADALRKRLETSQTELTAMTLALEEQRKRAEDTLTLLAAARTEAARAVSADERREAALAAAREALSRQEAEGLEAARRVALLNEQVAALRTQLGALQGLLDAAAAKDAEAQVQLQSLGTQLNSALAQVAAEQRRRADLEAAERRRLEAEKLDLEKFRSEFFGQLRQVLAGREGVRVVGDRFVFSSEVLFEAGSAQLAPEGQAQIAGVVSTLRDVQGQIPEGIDWIIRVDGHTDDVPLSGLGAFRDNWELSSARALSVVRFMQDGLGFPPSRLAATGFGEFRPVVAGDTPEARAQNRRIELKLTER